MTERDSNDGDVRRTPAPDPDGARRAAGLPPASPKPGVPAFLSPPPEPSLSNSPELRRILLLGIGLLVLIVVTLLSAPRGSSDPGPSTIVSPGPAAPPMSHEERVQTLFGGALLNVSDGGDFVESPGYLQILRDLFRYTPEEFSRQVTGTFDWNRAMRDSDKVRGDFVHLRGLLMKIEAKKLMSPRMPATDVIRCYIVDTDGSEPVIADVIEAPAEHVEPKLDVVDVEGVFYRLVGFESVDGRERQVPYLLCRTVRVFHPPVRGITGWKAGVLFGGIVVVAIVISIMLMRRREPVRRHAALLGKPGVGIRELFELRLRESGRDVPSRPQKRTDPRT